MENALKDITVKFVLDDSILFEAGVSVEISNDQTSDIARLYMAALGELRGAVRYKKTVSQEDYKRCDCIVIELPSGTRTYTESELAAVLDAYWEMRKIVAGRDSRMIVTLEGGFTGGLIKDPCDVVLSALNDEDFARVQVIADLLQTRRPNPQLQIADWTGDYGYYVKIGSSEADESNLRLIFSGGSFSRTPVIVEELEALLAKYLTE
jgi:hypothetical protein